jgi:predicted metal-dependent hydrolase
MEQITYQVIRSDRKTMALQILPDGAVVVRCPRRSSQEQIRRFVADHEAWIRKHTAKKPQVTKLTTAQIRVLADKAKIYMPPLIAAWAKKIGVTYGQITIRNQRTRWGSCSGKGNLNFNCMLMLAPPRVIEYVIVHELCHRKHMDHSPAFWALVQRHLPDWEERRGWLKQNGSTLLAQMP